MRIAYVTADHGIPVFGAKGASIHIQELTNAFVALDHDVTVLASRIGERGNTVRAPVVKVRSLIDEREQTELSGGGKALAKERYRLSVGRAMEEAITEHHRVAHFDCIYERYSLWSAAGVRAAKQIGVPCIVEVNAPLLLEQQRYRDLVLAVEAEAIEREVFTCADMLLTVSEQIRDYAVSNGADLERAVVVPNGVDPVRFHPDVPSEKIDGIGRDAFVVGFVGSLKAWHDHESLLDAFAIVARENPRFHLLIVGDGPTRNWIEGYIRGAGLDGRVTITGWVPYERLPGLLQAMDVAVAPYGQLQGFYFSPLKLFEYMAVGRPIVASAIGQVCEVIEDGRNGLLVTPGDVGELADKLLCLYEDSEFRQSLGRGAARSALEYTWEKNASLTAEIAGRLLEAA